MAPEPEPEPDPEPPPDEGALTPVPDNVMVAGESVALLATLTLPLNEPAAEGSKDTFKVPV